MFCQFPQQSCMMRNTAVATASRDHATDIRAVSKALRILRLLSIGTEGIGVVELGRRLGVHKSTVSRLVATLARHGFVTRDARTDRLALGPALISLGGAALQRMDLRSVAREQLERLSALTRETINLAIVDQDQVVNIERLPSPHYIRDIGWIGRRSPLHCTATGKALVAGLDREERRRLMGPKLRRYTEQTIADWSSLERDLAEVRRRGFAVGWEELEPGLAAVAAPIRDREGDVIAALSVSGPTFRVSRARLLEYASEVAVGAHEVSRALGYQAGIVTD